MALTAKKPSAVRENIPTKEAAKGELVRVNINVPAETRERWKIASIQRGISMSDLIVSAVEAALKK